MRENLSEQDLTAYALNELDPRERIYAESILAVSEEARHDVSQTIEMARILEQGYEREVVVAEIDDLSLRTSQRMALTRSRFVGRCILRDVAAALALAACVAFTITRLDGNSFSNARLAVEKVRAASVIDRADLAKALAALWQRADDNSTPILTSSDDLPEPTIICTPPPLVIASEALTGAR